MKKIIALVLALALVLASCAVAFADAPTGSITISNAAKGIKYNIYKLLDLTTDGEAIAYTYGTDGVLPGNLATYFPKVEKSVNMVDAAAAAKDSTDSTKLSDGAITAIKDWLNATPAPQKAAAEQTGNGSAVVFSGLSYGYYVITSTQGNEPKITVATLSSSNTPVVDKNTTEPDIHKFVADGEVEGEDGQTTVNWAKSTDAYIGAPVQYKVTAMTANWHEPVGGGAQKQVIKYIINDNLADGKLELISIDSIKVGGTAITLDPEPTEFPINIPWADRTGGTDEEPVYTSKYNNGVEIEIIYTAKLKDGAIIDTTNGNVNVADLDWEYPDGKHFGEGEEHKKDSTKTYTYGIAFVKVNAKGEKLAGAEFELPFKAHKLEGSSLNEWVYEPGTGTTTVTTTDDGAIIVRGLENETYTITETKAPNGYNQLAAPVSITAQWLSETVNQTSTDKYWKFDENNNKFDEVTSISSFTTEWHNDQIAVTAIPVLNLTGSVLPSTGGIGTTIFYILGGLLVVGAAVILIARRKAQD